jgi:hypothetical protein
MLPDVANLRELPTGEYANLYSPEEYVAVEGKRIQMRQDLANEPFLVASFQVAPTPTEQR